MKNDLLPMPDKLLLRKRCIIEPLLDQVKSHMGLEPARHRCPSNVLVHILSCLAATTLAQAKVKMVNIPIPSFMESIPYSTCTYPELGYNRDWLGHCRALQRH